MSFFDRILPSGNEEEPISVLRGFNGIAELYDNRVDIKKGKNKPPYLTLNLYDISEIHVKENGKLKQRYLSFVPKADIEDKTSFQDDMCTIVTNYKPELIYKFASSVQNVSPDIEILTDF